jgi:predicted amidohydrolase
VNSEKNKYYPLFTLHFSLFTYKNLIKKVIFMIKIAAIQMDIEMGNKIKNLDVAVKGIKEAAAAGAEIICLPELFSTGFFLEDINLIAEDINGETLEILCSTAKELGIAIISGSIALKKDENIFNTSHLIDKEGNIKGSYNKAHLFPLMNENTYFMPGQEINVINLPQLCLGIMICYDIRFPELARSLALKGAEALFIPSEFPNPRLNHWRILLQSRAIENQLYVMAVNRVGSDKNSTYFGHSMIISPWGEIIAEGGENEEIIYGNIEKNLINKARNKIPCFKDRRDDLYSFQS